MPIQQLIYIIAVVAGIIVLIKPEYLKHIVGGFLIAFGVLGLFTIARARIHIQNLIYLLAIVAGIVIFIRPQYILMQLKFCSFSCNLLKKVFAC